MGNQSDFIFGALILGFLLFITARKELPVYIGFFLKSGTSQSGDKGNAQKEQNMATARTVGKAIGEVVLAL